MVEIFVGCFDSLGIQPNEDVILSGSQNSFKTFHKLPIRFGQVLWYYYFIVLYVDTVFFLSSWYEINRVLQLNALSSACKGVKCNKNTYSGGIIFLFSHQYDKLIFIPKEWKLILSAYHPSEWLPHCLKRTTLKVSWGIFLCRIIIYSGRNSCRYRDLLNNYTENIAQIYKLCTIHFENEHHGFPLERTAYSPLLAVGLPHR